MWIGRIITYTAISLMVLVVTAFLGIVLWIPTVILVGLADMLAGVNLITCAVSMAIAAGLGTYWLSRAMGCPTQVSPHVSSTGFAAGFLAPPILLILTEPGRASAPTIWAFLNSLNREDLVCSLACLIVVAIVYAAAYEGAIAAIGGRTPHAKAPSCPRCGYNLYYATAQRCPECGRVFAIHELDLRLATWNGTTLQPKTPDLANKKRAFRPVPVDRTPRESNPQPSDP